MINKCKFENVNGNYVFLHDANLPFSHYDSEVDVRMDEQDRAGDWGIHETSTYLGKRIHHFEGDLLAEDSADYWFRRMDLIRALTPDKRNRVWGKLRIEFEGIFEDLWCNCTLDGWPELPLEALSPSAGKFMVSLKSYDPRLYGSYLNEVTLDTPEEVSGRQYPKTYDFDYSLWLSTTNFISNVGNAPTQPIIQIYGPVVNPRVYLVDTDEFVKLNVTVFDGQVVTIDLAQQTVADTAGLNLFPYVDRDSEWWSLSPGSNEVRLAADDVSGSGKAVIQWYNAYMI